jgi:hypothetical protein
MFGRQQTDDSWILAGADQTRGGSQTLGGTQRHAGKGTLTLLAQNGFQSAAFWREIGWCPRLDRWTPHDNIGRTANALRR